MRVLVTGATGLVGSAVARALVARGHAVRVLVRPSSDLSNLDRLPCQVARGDVLDPASVRAALAGCAGLVHAAGVVGFRPGLRERLMAVNVRGVALAFGIARELGVRRAVLTSSAAALGGSFSATVRDETSPSNAEALGLDYFVSKLRGERAALAAAAGGPEVVIVRPGYVLGPGDLGRSSGATALALSLGKLAGYVEGGVSFCHVADVAEAHVAALERGRPGEAYLLGGHNLRLSEAVGRVTALTGLPAPRRIPYPIALAAALGNEALGRVGRRPCPLTVDFVRSSSLYTFVSSDKAAGELGYRIRSFDDMARDTIRWWLARGRLAASTPELAALAAGLAAPPAASVPAGRGRPDAASPPRPPRRVNGHRLRDGGAAPGKG